MLYFAFANLPIVDAVTWPKKALPLGEGELQGLFEDLLFDVLLNTISLQFLNLLIHLVEKGNGNRQLLWRRISIVTMCLGFFSEKNSSTSAFPP